MPNQAVVHGRPPDHSLGEGFPQSIGADVPNHNEGYTSACGRPLDCSTTPGLSRYSDSFVRSPVTSGSLPRPPERAKWVDVVDVWEGLGLASTVGSIEHTYDTFSFGELL